MTEPMPTDLIGQAWLKTIVGTVPVATRLPDPASWGDTQLFVTVFTVIVQGLPVATSTYQVDVWGRSQSAQSNRPPYGQVGSLSRKIERACGDYMSPGTLTSGSFESVRVTDVSLRSGFVRRVESGGHLARFIGEIDITYLGE